MSSNPKYVKTAGGMQFNLSDPNTQAYLAYVASQNQQAQSQQQVSSSSTTTTAYVGMYRPFAERKGALSEIEYLEYTGHKLGETYQQTKQEALSALGVKQSDIKLTKQEEERLVQAYVDIRYQSLLGMPEDKSLIPGKESISKLSQSMSLIAEKGMLRQEIEKQGLAISEQTLQEYITSKEQRPDLTFPQFAYEKTIGSRSDIEKVGLGLFAQQALGFYDLGKYIGLPRQEYLDLMSIGLSYKPMIENQIIQGFIPFQRNELAFNIGVGIGIAIDIITLRGIAKDIVGFAKAPKTLDAFLSTSKLELGLKDFTAFYRDIGIKAEKMSTKQFITQSLNPINIARGIKEDISSFIKEIRDPMQRGVNKLISPGMQAEVREVITEVKPSLKEVQEAGFIPGKYEGKIVERVETPKGLSERSNIIFSPRFESKPTEYKVESIKEFFEGVKSDLKLSKDVYQYERKGDVKLVAEEMKVSAPKPTTTSITAIDKEVRKLKQELQKDIADYYLPSSEKAKPKDITPIEVPKFEPASTSKSGLTTVLKQEKVVDAYAQDIMRINKELEKQLGEIRARARRPKFEVEYEVIRYPHGVKPIMPTLPKSMSKAEPRIDVDIGVRSGYKELAKEITKVSNITKQRPQVDMKIESLPRSPLDIKPEIPTASIPKTAMRSDTQMILKVSSKPMALEATRLRGLELPKLKYDVYQLTKPRGYGFIPPKYDFTSRRSKSKYGKASLGEVEIFKYGMPYFPYLSKFK
jgi:hypothetical protein